LLSHWLSIIRLTVEPIRYCGIFIIAGIVIARFQCKLRVCIQAVAAFWVPTCLINRLGRCLSLPVYTAKGNLGKTLKSFSEVAKLMALENN
jgi:hypothetical protein